MILHLSAGNKLPADIIGIEWNLFDGLVEARIVAPPTERENFVFGSAVAEELVNALGESLREEEETAGFGNEVEGDLAISFLNLDFCFHRAASFLAI